MSYYRTATRINYVCGSCGLPNVSTGGIVQCLKCSVPLCNSCNRGYLCPQHFEALTPQHQQKVLEINKELQKKKGFGFIFLLILPIFFIPAVIVPLALSPNFNVLYIPIIVIGMTFIPVILIIVSLLNRKKKMDALVLEIRKIVSQDLGAQVPYTQSGIYQPAPAAYQPAPAAYQPAPAAYQPTPAAYQPTPAAYQPAPTAYQPAPGSIPVNKSQNYGVITQKLVCSDCGFENSPGNRFCGECGKKLQ